MSTNNHRIVSERETAFRLLRRYWRTPRFALSEILRLRRRARMGLPAVDLEWVRLGMQDCYALRRTHDRSFELWFGAWLALHRGDLDTFLGAAQDEGFSLGWLPDTIVPPAEATR